MLALAGTLQPSQTQLATSVPAAGELHLDLLLALPAAGGTSVTCQPLAAWDRSSTMSTAAQQPSTQYYSSLMLCSQTPPLVGGVFPPPQHCSSLVQLMMVMRVALTPVPPACLCAAILPLQ